MKKRLLFCFLFFVSLSAYSQCPINIDSVGSVDCNGALTGSITVSSTVSGYWTYTLEIWNSTANMWMPFGTINTANPSYTFINLPSDSFRVSVEDTLISTPPTGCVSAGIFVSQPAAITSNLTPIDESAPGACDGSISVSVAGGTPPYNYSWTGPSGYTSNNQNINNLCAGSYSLTLTDTNGCSTNLIDSVNSPIICDVVVNVMEQVTCPGGNDGMAEITNGSASFQVFSWDNLTNGINYGNGPLTTNSNLESGWYQVTGTDFNGNCPITVSDSFEIIEPTPSIQSSVFACIGDSVQLSVNVQNPKPGVNYYFSVNGNANTYATGSTSSEYLLLGNHYYTLFADTGNGLYTCGTNYIFSISGVDAINISIDSTLETCRGGDGSISIFAFGGGGSLTYSIDGGINFLANPIFPNLISGSYNVFVQESGACMQPYAYNPVIIGVTPINYVVDTVTTINESCCGDDGRIEIHVTGIDDSLKYSVDSGQTWQDSSSFFFLPAGDSNYVVVEDTNGCRTDWGYVSISADSVPDIDMTVDVTDIVCNGDTNGTFRVLDPDSCYSYALWRYTISPPYYIPVDTGTYFNGLIPGSYGVIATSNTGNCIDSSLAAVIDEPISLIQNGIAAQEVRCSNDGICDGEITLSSLPTGGTPPYYYSILDYGNNIPYGPIGSDSTFSGLCTDSFEVTLFDANACKVIDTVFIADSTLYIDSIITTNVTCFGYGDGTAIVYAHGGYSPYNYIWSNGSSTVIVDSLSNTQYSVIVTDTQNCLAYDTINISQPGELFFNIKVNGGFKPETCKGVSYDGEFYMNYQGGTAPFNWSWIGTSGVTGSGFGNTIPNLTFDTLTLFVVDSNGCIGQPSWIHADSARVDALNALNPLILDTIIADSILCYGTMLDTLFIVVKSGQAAYSYSYTNSVDSAFSADSFFTNLPAGNYNIEVQDVFGCSVYDTVIILQATEITIILDSIKHVDCYEWELNGYGIPGYIEVHGEGGNTPFQYEWDPSSSTSNIANNLPAGMQTVSVFYVYGNNSDICMKVDSFMITEPQKVISFASVTSNYNGWGVSCFGENNGEAFVHTQGGTPYLEAGQNPYTYSWKEVPNNPSSPPLSMDSTIATLSAGTYIVSIHDSLGCPSNATITISEPNEFLINILSNTPNPCFGDSLGELILTASGGSLPYNQFFVRDEQGDTMMVSIPTISDLAASDYDIWAVDINGCISNILTEKVGEPGEIEINIHSLINSTCFQSDDGALEISLISGTSPYHYELSENGNTITQGNINQTTLLVFDNLIATSYLLSITDLNHCPKDTIIDITEPSQVVAEFTSSSVSGKETFTINLTNNSHGANVFVWDYDDGNQEVLGINDMPIHSYNKQGQYEIMLVAENSLLSQLCNDTTFVTIDVQGLDVFNVFSPNDDGVNDIFSFDAWGLSSLYVEIYNRWGEKIYHWDSPSGSWNGRTYNDDPATDGVYYFFLKANGVDGYLYEKQGSITLLR